MAHRAGVSVFHRSELSDRQARLCHVLIDDNLRIARCDVVALTLDDLRWRAGQILIRQSKTGNPLELPLTDEVGSAIQNHLRKVPRYGLHRQVFLRLKAPGGTLKTTAVIEAFQAWSARSGLEIPFKGSIAFATPMLSIYSVRAFR